MKLRYINILTKQQGTSEAVITTDHPASSYGIPVVVLDDGDVIGAHDWVLNRCEIIEAFEDERPLIEKWLRNVKASTGADTGRPPIYGVPMIRTFASLRPDQVAWLKAQGKNVSETIRKIIDEAMRRERKA